MERTKELSNMNMLEDVDLSSFPLLRIDQIHCHDIETLVKSETQLTALEHDEAIESISPFVSKLLVQIRNEISCRRENNGSTSSNSTKRINGSRSKSASSTIVPSSAHFEQGKHQVKAASTLQYSNHLPSSSSMISPKRRLNNFSPKALTKKNQLPSPRHATFPSTAALIKRNQRTNNGQSSKTDSHQPTFFVSSNLNSKPCNFRSRSKLAKASLTARSNESVSRRLEQKRIERARQALETMQYWRTTREKSKEQRKRLLEQEREQRRDRKSVV